MIIQEKGKRWEMIDGEKDREEERKKGDGKMGEREEKGKMGRNGGDRRWRRKRK